MKYVRLGDISYLIQKGKAITPNVNGNIYAIGFTNIENGKINFDKVKKCKLTNEYMDLKIYNLELGDILFPPITRKNLVIKQLKELENSSNMIYSSRGVLLRINSNLYNPYFLTRLFSSEKYKEKLLNEVYTSGSYTDTFQISIERLQKFKVPLIPIEEQNAFAEKEEKIILQINKLQDELSKLYETL